MQITLTSPQEVIYKNEEFQAALVKIEEALQEGVITDNGDGWGKHIAVYMWWDDLTRGFIEQLYEPLGWTVSGKYSDRLMFVFPKSVT